MSDMTLDLIEKHLDVFDSALDSSEEWSVERVQPLYALACHLLKRVRAVSASLAAAQERAEWAVRQCEIESIISYGYLGDRDRAWGVLRQIGEVASALHDNDNLKVGQICAILSDYTCPENAILTVGVEGNDDSAGDQE